MSFLPDGLPSQHGEPTEAIASDLHYGDPMNAVRDERPKDKNKSSFSLLTLVLAIVLSTAIVGAALWASKDVIRNMIGALDAGEFAKFKESLEAKLFEINATDEKTGKSIEVLQRNLKILDETTQQLRVMTDKAEKENALLKIDNQQLQQKVVQLKESQAKAVKAATVKVEHPVQTVFLVSIRSQGGTPFVTLREGLETSPLLVKGDVWHEWEFIGADPVSHRAVFNVKGKAMELSL